MFVKLPQEYWLHVAQLDVTDTLRDYDWAWPLLIALALLLRGGAVVRRTPPAARARLGLRLPADPLPAAIDTAAEQAAWPGDLGPGDLLRRRSRRSCSSA